MATVSVVPASETVQTCNLRVFEGLLSGLILWMVLVYGLDTRCHLSHHYISRLVLRHGEFLERKMVKQNVEPEAKYKLLTIPLDKKHYGDQSTQHEEAQSRWENNSSATQ